MAATSEQMVMPTGQHSITSASSHEAPLGSTTAAKALTHNKTHSLSGTSIRSSKSEHRPSFSITLPPSCSRSSHLTSHSLVFNTLAGPEDDNDSTAGFEEALALQQQGNGASDNSGSQYYARLQTLDPPVRRRSVQFIPGEDDSLANHEGKHGLPKTPYPVTGEQDLEIQHSLFNEH
ncbi:hypothetical protein BGX24_001569 [Mortierella sp. AD032]|nr:hypothetical protein BGX24_001569 [Mortierella sp. AD032]